MSRQQGEIVMGMVLGPHVLNILGDFSGGFMMAGEVGLLLLVLEAGHDVDLTMLKLVCMSVFARTSYWHACDTPQLFLVQLQLDAAHDVDRPPSHDAS